MSSKYKLEVSWKCIKEQTSSLYQLCIIVIMLGVVFNTFWGYYWSHICSISQWQMLSTYLEFKQTEMLQFVDSLSNSACLWPKQQCLHTSVAKLVQ